MDEKEFCLLNIKFYFPRELPVSCTFMSCIFLSCIFTQPRIAYNHAVLVYQCLGGLAPAYLSDGLQPVAELPGRQRLRSSSTSALSVPPTRLCSTIGDQAFPIAAAKNVKQSAARSDVIYEHSSCKSKLKTFFIYAIFSQTSDCKVTEVLLHYPLKILLRYVIIYVEA